MKRIAVTSSEWLKIGRRSPTRFANEKQIHPYEKQNHKSGNLRRSFRRRKALNTRIRWFGRNDR
jgi:hypothetical protein